MLYIYKFTNKTNQKVYIGQTNNIQKRKNGHKSNSFNEKSSGYWLPFHCAIRKYGWENFDFEVLEEYPDEVGREFLGEREKYYIQLYHSLIEENGYNYTLGGEGCSRPPKTFEEKCKCSQLFTQEEIEDIQKMLCEYYTYPEIQKKYPQLGDSFLSNINTGLNFKRDDLEYPLLSYHTTTEKIIQDQIMQDIKDGIDYPILSKKYNISPGLLSEINSGKSWHRKELTYPLCVKVDHSWVEDCRRDIIFSDETLVEIAKRYGKSYSTIKVLGQGKHHRDERFRYPLRTFKNYNQQVYRELS